MASLSAARAVRRRGSLGAQGVAAGRRGAWLGVALSDGIPDVKGPRGATSLRCMPCRWRSLAKPRCAPQCPAPAVTQLGPARHRLATPSPARSRWSRARPSSAMPRRCRAGDRPRPCCACASSSGPRSLEPPSAAESLRGRAAAQPPNPLPAAAVCHLKKMMIAFVYCFVKIEWRALRPAVRPHTL